NRYDFMKQAELLRQQSNDAWIELPPKEIDKFDTNLLGPVFEPFRHDAGQPERDFGMLGEEISKVGPGQGEYNGMCNRAHRRRSGLSGQQRHLADGCPFG